MLKVYSLHDAIWGRPALRDRRQADLHMTCRSRRLNPATATKFV